MSGSDFRLLTSILGSQILGVTIQRAAGQTRSAFIRALAKDEQVKGALQKLIDSVTDICPMVENRYDKMPALGDIHYLVKNWSKVGPTKQGALVSFLENVIDTDAFRNLKQVGRTVEMQMRRKFGFFKESDAKVIHPKPEQGGQSYIGQPIPSDTTQRRELEKKGSVAKASNLSEEQGKGLLEPNANPDATMDSKAIPDMVSYGNASIDETAGSKPSTEASIKATNKAPESVEASGQAIMTNPSTSTPSYQTPVSGSLTDTSSSVQETLGKPDQFVKSRDNSMLEAAISSNTGNFGEITRAGQQQLSATSYQQTQQGLGGVTAMGGQPGTYTQGAQPLTTIGDNEVESAAPGPIASTEESTGGMRSMYGSSARGTRTADGRWIQVKGKGWQNVIDKQIQPEKKPIGSFQAFTGLTDLSSENDPNFTWSEVVNMLGFALAGAAGVGAAGTTALGKSKGVLTGIATLTAGGSVDPDTAKGVASKLGKYMQNKMEKYDPEFASFVTGKVIPASREVFNSVAEKVSPETRDAFVKDVNTFLKGEKENDKNAPKDSEELQVRHGGGRKLLAGSGDDADTEMKNAFAGIKRGSPSDEPGLELKKFIRMIHQKAFTRRRDSKPTPTDAEIGRWIFLDRKYQTRSPTFQNLVSGLIKFAVPATTNPDKFTKSDIRQVVERERNQEMARRKAVSQNEPYEVNPDENTFLESLDPGFFGITKQQPKLRHAGSIGSTSTGDVDEEEEPSQKKSRIAKEEKKILTTLGRSMSPIPEEKTEKEGKSSDNDDVDELLRDLETTDPYGNPIKTEEEEDPTEEDFSTKRRVEKKRSYEPSDFGDESEGDAVERWKIVDSKEKEHLPGHLREIKAEFGKEPYSDKNDIKERLGYITGELDETGNKTEATPGHGLPYGDNRDFPTLRLSFAEGGADIITRINQDPALMKIDKLAWVGFQSGWDKEANQESDNPLYAGNILEQHRRFYGDMQYEEYFNDQSKSAIQESYDSDLSTAYYIPDQVVRDGQVLQLDTRGGAPLVPLTPDETDAQFHDVYLPPWTEIPEDSAWKQFTQVEGTQMPDSYLNNPSEVTGNDWPLLAMENAFIYSTLS
jgi:hypothetical protein